MKNPKNRQFVNLMSISFTCVILFLAVQFSDGGVNFSTRLKEITQNLKNAVMNLNDDDVSYSNFTNNALYISSTKFHSGGMAGLYNLTSLFIDVIITDDILMDGVISIDGHNDIQINSIKYSDAAKHYASLIALVIFLLICAVLFPLCGFCFCCCRCCGNCGAKRQPSDKKRDTGRKFIYATLLIIFGTGLLFCIVCAFASNQHLEDGLNEFPSNLGKSVSDTKTFMDTTNDELSYLLVTNYQEFSSVLTGLMDNATTIAMDELIEFENASAVSTIYDFIHNLENIKASLNLVKIDTNKLRVLASQLNDAVRKVKRDLTTILNDCGLPECFKLKDKIDKLQTNIDFNKVPDVSDMLQRIVDLNFEKLEQDVNEGQKKLDDIKNHVNSSLSDGLNEARIQLKSAGKTIETNLKDVKHAIEQAKNQTDSTASPVINNSRDFINKYGNYRNIVGITISSILLSVAILIVFGLTCGVCGKRPDGYSDNCCNKGTGSQFLMCAVYIMFFFGFIITILTLFSLIFGIFTEKIICDSIRNPDPTTHNIIKLLDQYNFPTDYDMNVKLSSLLQNCYRNNSIYETFNMQTIFDIEELKKKFDVKEQLDKLIINFTAPDSSFHLISNESLEELKKINPELNVDAFVDELSRNLTTYSLDKLSTELDNVITQVERVPQNEDLVNSLQLSLMHLNTYDEKLVKPMKQISDRLIDTAETLSGQFKMGYNNFSEAIDALMSDIRKTEQILIHDAPGRVNETGTYFKNITLKIIDGYMDRVSVHVQHKIGQCGPLSRVINSTLTSTCEKILLPWNGFWFSLFWTIILYVITIIICVKLANLYRKHKPYDQYVEAEYLYDAYADRGDNIPLNSRSGKRGKNKKGKKSKRYEERPNSARDVARDYPGGSHPPDGRYADMAPKQWEDFPNGGPPHYQRAPTEYERPPPYYYPGNGGDKP